MRISRSLLPFCIGFGLLYVVLIELRGFLAARQVPIEYFRFFGKEHQELSLFITNVVLHLVPESIVLILGVLVCSRALKGSSTFNAGILAFGAAVSYFFWLLFYQVVAHTQTGAESQRFWQDFLRQFSAPWWAMPALLSPLIGIGLGVWLVTKRGHAAGKTEA